MNLNQIELLLVDYDKQKKTTTDPQWVTDLRNMVFDIKNAEVPLAKEHPSEMPFCEMSQAIAEPLDLQELPQESLSALPYILRDWQKSPHTTQAEDALGSALNQHYNQFYLLPAYIPLLANIFLMLRPTEVIKFMVLNRQFNALLKSQPYWKKATRRLHLTMIRLTDVNWLDQFSRTYQRFHTKLTSRQKMINSAFNNNDIELLQSLNPIFPELKLEVRTTSSYSVYLNFTHRYLNQKTQDFIFERIVVPFYKFLAFENIQVDTEKKTLASWAAILNQADALKTTIDDNINHRDKVSAAGKTPLHYAAQYGQLESAKTLIDAGADVNAKTVQGETPLHLAAANGYASIIHLLANSNADLNASDRSGKTPLITAILYGRTKAVKAFITEKASLIQGNDQESGKTPLHYAVIKSLKITKLLLANGVNPDITTTTLRSPLHFAALFGHLDVLKILLAHKGNPHLPDKVGKTPLYVAIDGCSVEVVSALLQLGADFVTRDDQGILQTPLSLAKKFYAHRADNKNNEHENKCLAEIIKILSRKLLAEYITITAEKVSLYQTSSVLFSKSAVSQKKLNAAIALKRADENDDSSHLEGHEEVFQRNVKLNTLRNDLRP